MNRDTNGKCWSLGCTNRPETDVHVPGDDLDVTVCEFHADLFTSVGPWEVSESTGKEDA